MKTVTYAAHIPALSRKTTMCDADWCNRSVVRHHLPQLLEEVLDEEEALELRGIAFCAHRSGSVSRKDESITVGMECGAWEGFDSKV